MQPNVTYSSQLHSDYSKYEEYFGYSTTGVTSLTVMMFSNSAIRGAQKQYYLLRLPLTAVEGAYCSSIFSFQ